MAGAVNELPAGRAIVLVDLPEIPAGEARERLEQLAPRRLTGRIVRPPGRQPPTTAALRRKGTSSRR